METTKILDFSIPLVINGNGHVTQSHYAGTTPLIAEVAINDVNHHILGIWPKEMKQVVVKGAVANYIDLAQYPGFDKSKYPCELFNGMFLPIQPGMTFYIFKSGPGEHPTIGITTGTPFAPALVEASGELKEEPQPQSV